MPKRERPSSDSLRAVARAVLAMEAWLQSDALFADAGDPAREVHRLLRASRKTLSPPGAATVTYDSFGRVTEIADSSGTPAYSLRLGTDGEVLVATRTDIFVFELDAHEVVHFIARRPRAPGASQEGPWL